MKKFIIISIITIMSCLCMCNAKADTNILSKFEPVILEVENEKYNVSTEAVGCAVLSGPILEKLNWAFNIIKYGGSILAILLGSADFLKAVLSDEEKSTNKAAQRFLKRLIAAVLIFLLPLIIQFVLNNVEIEGFNTDAPTCGVAVSDSDVDNTSDYNNDDVSMIINNNENI